MERKRLIFGAIVFQVLILGGMLVKAMLPLLTGSEVTLPVVPRDPREIFRGDYVALNYEFSRLHLDSIANDLDTSRTYHFGDRLFLLLEPEGDIFRPAGLYRHHGGGGEGRYLKVLVNSHARYGNLIELSAGIESYFTDPARAQELENLLNARPDGSPPSLSLTVTVMIAPDGTARIKQVNLPSL